MFAKEPSLWCGLAAFVWTQSVCAAAQMPLPLGIAQLSKYIEDNHVGSLDELLADLPPSMQKNFALVYESGSLQEATPTNPRQILFGVDAHFIIAVSGVKDDSRYDELEYAELNGQTGHYDYGTIDFSQRPPGVSSKIESCNSCHGSPPHPIWSSYPEWPGVYGDLTGEISGEDLVHFNVFLNAQRNTARYAHLQMDLKQSSDSTLLLLAPYHLDISLNDSINENMASAITEATFSRLKPARLYPAMRWAIIAGNTGQDSYGYTLTCRSSSSWQAISALVQQQYDTMLQTDQLFASMYASRPVYDPLLQAYRIAGVDPQQFILDFTGGTNDNGTNIFFWGAAGAPLSEVLNFRVFMDVEQDDSEIAQAVAPKMDAFRDIADHLFLAGEEREKALSSTGDGDRWFQFDRVFQPIFYDDSGKQNDATERVCSILRSRLATSLATQ